MKTKKYKKLKLDNHIYYISEHIYDICVIERSNRKITIDGKDLHFMQFSDFVIDIRTNELVKCRSCIEDLIDAEVLGISFEELK
jgi:CRISPR/Cas system-associated endoribonuclease Cas2